MRLFSSKNPILTTALTFGVGSAVLMVSLAALGQRGGSGAGTTKASDDPTDVSSVRFQNAPRLSEQEQTAQANQIISHMEATGTKVRGMLGNAREKKNPVKVLCLNDKLSQVDVANRAARERHTGLKSAIERHDGELAQHEFTIMTVLRTRTDQLGADANLCLGDEAAFVSGETRVTTSIDPSLPPLDGIDLPPPIIAVIVDPPSCGSCVK